MHYQILNILRRFITGPVGRWLALLMVLLPLVFILSRFLGLSRQAIMMVMFGVLIIFVLIWAIGGLKKVGDRKRSKDFESDLGSHSRAPASQEEIREAVGELGEQWKHAMLELKEARTDIYALPWFLLIGEPQSGKSTTLLKSGLEFPIGADALSGAGGTRNCDWWFTEEAVILDTAGRFSFQEDVAPDRHEWEHFLGLLKKHRKECPINGVLTVIPATSLTEDTPEEQEEKAKNIRKKLFELQKQLDIRFPIFVLITKADRILGFTEFFAPLDPHDKGQIFGWSDPEETDRWDDKSFGNIFTDMVQRMHKIRLRLLRSVPDSEQADRMFVFPEELAALEEPLHRYLDTIFRASRFEEPLILRGFYLTSGMQEGRPIARACRDLLRVQAGDPQGVLEDLQSIFTRQYAFFIRDLYEKKVFPEQGLVRQTVKAKQKAKRNKRLVYGLIGGAVVAAFILLLPALIHMSQVLRPINNLTKEAKLCIDAAATEEPCSVLYTWELVHELEKIRRDLGTSKWKIRILLQGGINNEISNELVPTVQAGLMRNGVLLPLLESFEARSRPEIWQGEPTTDYATYRQAFETRLRFDRYQQATTNPETKDQLRQGLTLAPLLRFLKSQPGRDANIDGREIDEWLVDGSQFGDIEQIEAIFQSVLHADERFDLMDVGRLETPQQARATFEAYWTMPVLARWDYQLIDSYLGAYQETYDSILALDPLKSGGDAALASFSGYGSQLGTTLEQGRTFFASAPRRRGNPLADADDAVADDPTETTGDSADDGLDADDEEAAPEPTERRRRRRSRRAVEDAAEEVVAAGLDARPGNDVQAWQKNCLQDYAALQQIFPRLVSEGNAIDSHCRIDIPRDWQQLVDSRSAYDHLYSTAPDGTFEWSEGAETLAGSLSQLAQISSPETVDSERSAFQTRLETQSGDDGKLAEIKSFYEGRKTAMWTPVDQLALFERSGPDPRFEILRGRNQAAAMAALAAGLEILPPTLDYLRTKLTTDCRPCFSKTYAESFVPPTNDFLRWANIALAPATNVREVRSPLGQINEAVYNYLEAYIDSQGGGGGGGGLSKPSTQRADTWPEFTRIIRNWRLTAAPTITGADGLTSAMVQEYARANSNLQPLVDKISQRSRRREPAKISPELERTIQSYRRTVEVLDDDPLEAWKQLALSKDGASLDDFHAFSRNRRLQRGSDGPWMVRNVEVKGAELLSEGIRPAYQRAADDFWRDQQACCLGRFPFITDLELRRQRLLYNRGYLAADAGELWLEPEWGPDSITLPILLETANEDEIDRIFFPGGSLDRLFDDFALDVLLARDGSGEPKTSIDFVDSDRGRLEVLHGWQVFLYGEDDGSRRRALGGDQEITVTMQEDRSTGDRLFIGKRAVQVDLFGPAPVHSFRPSTDAGTGQVRRIPLILDDRNLYATVSNEDTAKGWIGRLEVRGGPLKLLYFIHLAAETSRAGNREWTIRVEVPDFERHPRQSLDGLFDLSFERPLPGVLPDDAPRRNN